jgi:propionyl-CoA carboxylase alpha chain
VLERMVIAGVVTNRDFLVAALRSPEFLAGDTHTDFIEKVAPAPRFVPSRDDLARSLAAVVAFHQAEQRASARHLAFMPSGYRNSVMPPQELRFVVDERDVSVTYRSVRDGGFDVWVDGATVALRVVPVAEVRGGIVVEIDGLRARFDLVRSDLRWHVRGPAGSLDLVQIPRFPDPDGATVVGGQIAPMPGAIRVVAVTVGDQVTVGQTLIVMEAMKMEHTISAPGSATVIEVRCAVGDQVDNGQVLVVLEEVPA